MSLFDKAKEFAVGAEEITAWLGSGGKIVPQEVAQERANICLECAKNVEVGVVKDTIASATRKILEAKNKLGLRIDGEKRLGMCSDCGCVLRLLVWQPQERVQPYLTEEDLKNAPTFCWKLRKP